ncbi:hypothetical protein A0256_16650 [Mucilaginibacter sp. PAMC 26640]|nr:hypothetical protein A0256_16650 [Mucilaginibacter sp. PAMC 26640]
MPKIGLVTVLYKCDNVLEGFFKSLSKQTFKDYELYIIDNSASIATDRILEKLSNEFILPAITHIKNTENFGVAKGNNQGIELALNDNCDFVLLLNNDIEFDDHLLIERMIVHALKNNELIIIPKIFYFDTRTIWMAGGKLLKSKAIVEHVGVDEQDGPKFNKVQYFDYAPTCFMLLGRRVFDEVGLMDERYFVYYDDTDFILRAVNAGFKILYLPNLEIFHKVSSSTGGGVSLFSIYYLNRNRIYFIMKNFTFPVRQIALLYTFFTRFLVYVKYDRKERKELLRSLRDGFKLSK